MTETLPRHIVAINNSPDVLAVLADLLTAEGYRVTTQVYHDHALAEIGALAPDLIILDYQWASDDAGWSLLQLLRLFPETTTVPIVLCTAAIEHVEETRDHLDAMGIAILYKPFNLEQLLVTLRHLLASPDRGAHRNGSVSHDDLTH